MTNGFLVGAITGIIALTIVIAIDAQWYVTFLVAIGIGMIDNIMANKLGAKDE